MKKILVILNICFTGAVSQAMSLPEISGQVLMTGSVLTTPLTGTFMCLMAEFDRGTKNYPVVCEPTHATLDILDSNDKEVILAAKEDATLFFMDGSIKNEKSALLESAFEVFKSTDGLQGMTEKEMAAAIVLISENN